MTPAGRTDELLSTGEAAARLGMSRTYVVELCEKGVLPFERVSVHRKVPASAVERFKGTVRPMTRDQMRSRWLGYAIAGHLVADTQAVIAKARANLALMRSVHTRGQGARWLAEWQDLLDGPVEAILDVLTSPSERARELRQNTPFAGVLPEEQRRQVLAEFRRSSDSRAALG